MERLILFGSKARGDSRSDSDLDLLGLTARPVHPAEKARIVSAVFDLQLELNVQLSIMVASVEAWESGCLQLLPIPARVEREGALV